MTGQQQLIKLERFCNAVNRRLGKLISWLSLAMVLASSAIVLVRLAFSQGSVAAQESILYAHASLFMLCLGFNLQQDAHVRVDVFYHRFGAQTRAWINSLGAILLLLPFALFMVFISGDFVQRAWQIKESSMDPGGLQLVYLLKTLIPAAGVLLFVQGIGQICAGMITLSTPRGETQSD